MDNTQRMKLEAPVRLYAACHYHLLKATNSVDAHYHRKRRDEHMDDIVKLFEETEKTNGLV